MAKKAPVFDLGRFVVQSPTSPDSGVPVCIPQGRFRIHPDRRRCIPDVYVSRAGDEWWLIAADVVEEERVRIPKLWRADLYEGLRPTGESFVLPVTFPVDGEKRDWYDTLTSAMTLARKQWVSVKADKSQKCFLVAQGPKFGDEPAEWPDCDLADLIEVAFGDRIIYTREDAEARLPKRPRREVSEDFDE